MQLPQSNSLYIITFSTQIQYLQLKRNRNPIQTVPIFYHAEKSTITLVQKVNKTLLFFHFQLFLHLYIQYSY